MDLLLDGSGDLDTTAGRLTLTSGAESVRQHWQIRNKFFLGEWFLDRRIGVAFFQQILIKGTPLDHVRDIFRKVLSRTPGVRTVSRFDFTFDGATRELRIDAEGFLEPGVVPEITGAAPFAFTYGEFILKDQILPENRGIA